MKREDVRIVNDVSMRVIYIRFRGTYVAFRKQSRKMVNQLFSYAEQNNLIIEGVTKVMTLYHDNPHITKDTDLRTSVAMTVPHNAKLPVDDDVCDMVIKGKFGIGRFNLNRTEYGDAWQSIYNDWLFKSNVTPRDAFPFELYIDQPPKNARDTSTIDIYIPIE